MGFGKDGKGVIIHEQRTQAIGTLASDTDLLIGTKLAMTDHFRMLRAEVNAVISGGTAAAAEQSGMLLGLAEGSLTIAQINECLEVNGPVSRSSRVPEEQSNRPVWLIGAFERSDIGDTIWNLVPLAGFADEKGGTHGVVVKPRWTFGDEGVGWNWFLRNNGPAPTTGANVRIMTKDFGVWVMG